VELRGGRLRNLDTSTSGMGIQNADEVERRHGPFVFFENGILYKRYLSDLLHSMQDDSPSGWKTRRWTEAGGRHQSEFFYT